MYFYLEDGSLHIAEAKQENSGIPQVWATEQLFFLKCWIQLPPSLTPTIIPSSFRHEVLTLNTFFLFFF